MTQKLEPTVRELRASYTNKPNVRLARALFAVMAWGPYERSDGHRWALKLIKANPQTVEETVAALVNYDWMIEGALAAYTGGKRKQWDGAFKAYTEWKAAQAAQQEGSITQ